jgi:hypothetical protein
MAVACAIHRYPAETRQFVVRSALQKREPMIDEVSWIEPFEVVKRPFELLQESMHSCSIILDSCRSSKFAAPTSLLKE